MISFSSSIKGCPSRHPYCSYFMYLVGTSGSPVNIRKDLEFSITKGARASKKVASLKNLSFFLDIIFHTSLHPVYFLLTKLYHVFSCFTRESDQNSIIFREFVGLFRGFENVRPFLVIFIQNNKKSCTSVIASFTPCLLALTCFF